MARELVTEKQLSEILTAKLREIEGLGDAALDVKYRLIEPGNDGCNWEDVVSNAATGGDLRAMAHVREIVRWARDHVCV